MERRREALGRNRRGPDTRNLVPLFVFLAALLVGSGWFAFHYFTQPQRVFGARTLDCGALDVSWRAESAEHRFIVTGCGRSAEAICRPKAPCRTVESYP